MNGVWQHAEALHEDVLPLLKKARELDAAGRLDQSTSLLHEVLTAHPDHPRILKDLTLNLYRMRRLDEALRYASKMRDVVPADPTAVFLMALVRLVLGALEESLALADKAMQMNPDSRVLGQLGALYRTAGARDKACQAMMASIEKDPDNVFAYFSLHRLRPFLKEDPLFDNLVKMAARAEDFPVSAQIILHFTLGRAYFDQKDFANAFAHYEQGNALQKSVVAADYNPDFLDRYVDTIISLFDSKRIKRLAGKSAHVTNQPIFIVGMPRSGSSLADQILSSHPDVASMGEVPYFPASVPVYPSVEVPGFFRPGKPCITQKFMDDLSPDVLNAIGDKYLSVTTPFLQGKHRLVDKMLFNYIWVGLMRLVFPQGKVIYTSRDPVDTGLSIWRTLFEQNAVMWAYDQVDIGRYYLSFKAMMDHWQDVLPGEVHELNYERLVSDQEGESRKLLEFCGLPWNEHCLRFHETERQVRTASADQVRRAIYKDSIKSWEKHAQYLQTLMETVGIVK